MPVLSKAGCNAGTCHGNKNGKGGFKLSLRGQDPDLDYATLTRDVFSRRVNPVAPEESLILLKPTTQVAHEGGSRFDRKSPEYEILRSWIAERMPDDSATAPRLDHVEVAPLEQVLIEPAEKVQLRVRGAFSDGSTRDVTGLAVYETANRGAKINHDGLVERQSFGETTVLVRFLQQQTPVRLAFVPARASFKWQEVRANNYIDEHIFSKLRRLRMNASRLCSDEIFLRRAFLDLVGILPTADEARRFTAEAARSPGKARQRLIEALFERSEFADYWALKWADLLRVEAHSLDQKGVQNFHHWIRQSIVENKPINEFARALIMANGSTYRNPAANFYRPTRDPAARAKAAAQVFLGTRLQCAECHNHPFERWTQDDYYDWAGLFSHVNYKVLQNDREISSDQHEWKGEQVVFASEKGTVKNPRTGKDAVPRFLGAGGSNANEGQFLGALADWLTSPTNRTFARVQVNRIWFHLFGRGIVEPVEVAGPVDATIIRAAIGL